MDKVWVVIEDDFDNAKFFDDVIEAEAYLISGGYEPLTKDPVDDASGRITLLSQWVCNPNYPLFETHVYAVIGKGDFNANV